ncbi:FxsB family cyclophane-forming radical SAM/SPASM peptide maturase, partial [Nocardia gamkensis]|uniref:FxsB family cyclophane-forming radical SAM/SPASM peptide maturase n=2 Tax=Nocardiaceae TaxID=85025 RepID=UPI003407B566
MHPNYEPLPFRQYVIKVHSRCDLACDHCYMYEHADQSWRGRPMEFAPETAAQVGFRIAEHAAGHALRRVSLVLHGGEPLLLGPARTRETLATLTAAIAPVAEPDLYIHTNGVRLDEEFLDLFVEYNVRVGVSLDGDRAANDRHRLYRNGRSSYDKVLAGLELLRKPQYRQLYTGLLCTVDIANDPAAVYRGLLEQEPPALDLLLPHSNWEHQPPGLRAPRDPDDPTRGGGEYSDWLIAMFEAWNADGRPVPLRTFDSLLAAMYGRPSGAESFGLDPVDLLVIETDGTLEQVDSLKTAYPGAAATGLDVWRNSLDEAAAIPGITVRQQGVDGIGETCRSCTLVQVCGGGFYPDRYRPGAGFDNPSVYCADLKELIEYMAKTEADAGRGGAQTAARDSAASAHSLSDEQFARLGAGFGDAAAVSWLGAAQ